MQDVAEVCTIVALEKKDIPALTELEAQCFAACWTPHQYALFLASNKAGGMPVLAALQGQRHGKAAGFVFGLLQGEEKILAGYVSLLVQFPIQELEIFNIAVRLECRRQGVARRLLETLFDAAGQSGIGRVLLEVRETNTPALGLYRSLGFEECGRRKQYYTDTGEDALLFSLNLDEK